MAVYEEYYTPSTRKREQLSDVIPWRAMIAPGVMLHKERHGLQRTYAVRGPDIMGESPEVQGALMLRANEVLKRLGGRWMLQSEAQRQQVTTLPPVSWPHSVLHLLDQERRQSLLEDPGSRETRYYMTLTWWPPTPGTRRGLRLLVAGEPPDIARRVAQDPDGLAPEQQVSLLEFVRQADYFMELLKGMLAHCQPLSIEETTTYLHNCVSTRWYELGPLAFYHDLDSQLCDTAFWGGWYPALGGDPRGQDTWHLRTCSIMGYPAKSMVGIVRHLDAANLDYRWCTRWVGLEKHVQSGLLRKTQGAWMGQERSLMARMAESMSNQPTRMLNTDATNKAEEVDAARQEIGADIVAYGEFTSTVTVWDTDPEQAETKLRHVMQTLANQGFTATAERQQATAAWLSTQPGNRVDNVHRSHHHSLFLAHVSPGVTAAWPGPERDDHLKAGPWFYVHTEHNTLFRVINHIRDLGHFLLLGATRSGKSTLGNFLRAQWMQYPNAQAKVFDLDGHARLLTYLLGGTWHDLGSPTLRFQPLRHVEDPVRRGIALQWLLDLCAEFGIPLSAGTHGFLSSNLTKLAAFPPAERTVSRLLVLMADHTRHVEMQANSGRIDAQGISHPDMDLKALAVLQLSIRQTLHQFAEGGEYGGIFDGTEDVLGSHPVQTFELRSLLQRPRLVGPVLGYVFPELERQMRTDAPMFLLLDDAAVTWLTPRQEASEQQDIRKKLENRCRDWLMTSAKKNVSLGFSTHSLSQVFSSALGPLLEEGCPSRFFLPMTAALEPNIAEIYMRLGLTENALRTIATSRPQRDVYYACKEMGQRAFSWPLGPLGLNCFASNRAEDHALMDDLLAKEGPEGFAPAWLRAHGFEEEAHDVETYHKRSYGQEDV
jgi:type IV secretory pathway VirB4 component